MTKKAILMFVAVVLGIFLAIQSNSLDNLNSMLQRDGESNIFQEIRLLKTKNADLAKEIGELENTVEDLADQKSSLKAIDDQIIKYKKLTGMEPVSGVGVIIKLDGDVTTPWIVDLINELFGAGAQAVDINGIRLVNETAGFDTLPKGQPLLNGSILSPPYIIRAIGDSNVLEKAPNLPGAIFDRLEAAFKGLKIETSKSDLIEMN